MTNDKIAQCDGDRFSEIRSAIIKKLTKPDDNLKERSGRIWNEISLNTYDYNRMKSLLEAEKKMVYQDMVKLHKNIFYDNPNRLTIYNYAGKSDSKLIVNDVRPYSLNNKLNVTYTDNLNIFNNQEYISGYKIETLNKIANRLGKKKSTKSSKKNKSFLK